MKVSFEIPQHYIDDAARLALHDVCRCCAQDRDVAELLTMSASFRMMDYAHAMEDHGNAAFEGKDDAAFDVIAEAEDDAQYATVLHKFAEESPEFLAAVEAKVSEMLGEAE